MRKLGVTLSSLAVLSMGAARSTAQTTLFFDGSGAENGVTEAGTQSFSFMGSNWSGGVVETEGRLALYASGSFSYEIEAGGGSVTFDPPVGSVRFFYVHGFGFNPGVASAFDASDASVGMADSRQATFFGDPNNFVSIESETPIARIDFSSGVIDNFTFNPAPAQPTPTPQPTDTPVPPSTATATTPPTSTPSPTEVATREPVACVADCNGDGTVDIAELVRAVQIVLGILSLDDCRDADFDGDEQVTIDELVAAVGAAIRPCIDDGPAN